MDVATVDYWATGGRSYLHRASPAAKVIAGALCLAVVIGVENVLIIAALYLVVLAAARRAAIPLRRFVLASLYPGLFAVLFALASYDGSLVLPLTIIAKAVTAAAVVVLVIATTPYPRLFATFHGVLPGVIVDVLYITYRSVFIVLGLLGDVLTSLRLRGGLLGRNVRERLRNLAAALGVAAIRSFDEGEHTYAVMRVRGYSGAISGEQRQVVRRHDLPLLVVAGAVAVVAFTFRVEWRALNPYSWFPALLALVVLIVMLVLPRPGLRSAASVTPVEDDARFAQLRGGA